MISPIRGIYAHVPFCTRICGYCDFYVRPVERGAGEPLVAALLQELAYFRARHALQIETIFVGGGTPTTLPPELLLQLLKSLRSAAADTAALEFSIEANPATVSPRVAAMLAEAGVTRVSIGAQSFDAGELVTLERTHSPRRIAETVTRCRAAGIAQVSLDLIYAVPGQDLSSWRKNLAAAIALGPDHISCYALTYETGTPFHQRLESGSLRRADNSLEADMFDAAIDELAAAGFEQYEISNFARPGSACRHNMVYWNNDSHIGLGPSACGFVAGVRYRNAPDLAAWAAAVQRGDTARVSEEELPRERRIREAAMLRLRTRAGIELREFGQRYSCDPLSLFVEPIKRNLDRGLLEVDGRRIRLSRAGMLLGDRVLADFL